MGWEMLLQSSLKNTICHNLPMTESKGCFSINILISAYLLSLIILCFVKLPTCIHLDYHTLPILDSPLSLSHLLVHLCPPLKENAPLGSILSPQLTSLFGLPPWLPLPSTCRLLPALSRQRRLSKHPIIPRSLVSVFTGTSISTCPNLNSPSSSQTSSISAIHSLS